MYKNKQKQVSVYPEKCFKITLESIGKQFEWDRNSIPDEPSNPSERGILVLRNVYEFQSSLPQGKQT